MSLLSKGLQHFTETPLPVTGLIIFLMTFIGISFATFLQKPFLGWEKKMAEMPLHEEDSQHE